MVACRIFDITHSVHCACKHRCVLTGTKHTNARQDAILLDRTRSVCVCVCVCVCVYIYIYIMCICIYMFDITHSVHCACKHRCVLTGTKHTNARQDAIIGSNTKRLCVCVCVCVYIYIYIYIYTHTRICVYIKSKAIPIQAWTGPEGSSRLRLPEFQDNQHMKVVSLSALRTGRLYPPGNIPGTHFC